MKFLGIAAWLAISAFGQVSDNSSLSGKYFFRHVLFATAGFAGAHTGFGTINFDGKGGFTVTGHQLTGINPADNLGPTGTYTVKPGGFVTLTNPLNATVTINARLGVGALVGSSTEAGPDLYDLFFAIPAAAQPASIQTLNGPYWISSLEFVNGGFDDIRESNFKSTANGAGSFSDTTVNGQGTGAFNNKLNTQNVGGITYSVAPDGSGTIHIPPPAGPNAPPPLITPDQTIYVAQDGSYFIGGSSAPGGHGLVVGVRAFAGGASNASWNGSYFAAGFRYDVAQPGTFPRPAAVSGSVHAIGDGNSAWSRRTRQPDRAFDVSPLITYSLGADGSGPLTSTSGHINLASTKGVFSTSGVDVTDSFSYEIYFGALMPAQSGSGVFLHPQGIFNSGSFAPAGYPVAPGTFVTLFGSGFGSQNASTTTFPVNTTLANVQVTVNGIFAPVYSVVGSGPSPLITAIVPYGVTGPIATFQVIVNNVKSNTVDVPLAPTAPGVFSVPPNGISNGAIRHADGTVVNQDSPASRGETVAVYVAGLGAVNPSVDNGQATPTNTLYKITGPVNVYVGGQLTQTPAFAGLTPTLAGLYQLNITIPFTVSSGPQSLAIDSLYCFTDMVTIWVQ